MEQNISNIKLRILQHISNESLSKRSFYIKTGIANGVLNKKTGLTEENIERYLSTFPEINPTWLLTGEGEMFKKQPVYIKQKISKTTRNSVKLVPLYDELHPINGFNKTSENEQMEPAATEYIDSGNWFNNDITSAIRHYGNSMKEYPSGCILALKEVYNKDLIIWGCNYVVETDEYRITRRLQKGMQAGYIMACSSNEETDKSNKIIYEPIEIPLVSIKRISLVLGRVVKEQGLAPYITVQKNNTD